MHRSAAWGLTVALAAGAAAPAAAADPAPPAESRPADSKPWYARLVGGSSDKKPDPEKTFADAPARPPVVYAPLDPTTRAEALRAEQDAWQRRMDVCHRLRRVAAQLNDDKLTEQADELERHATALYHQRVARLGVKAPPAGGAAVDRVSPLEPLAAAPPAPAPTGSEPQTRQFREVQP